MGIHRLLHSSYCFLNTNTAITLQLIRTARTQEAEFSYYRLCTACNTPEAATIVPSAPEDGRKKAAETCREILQLPINIMLDCIELVFFIYINI